MPLPLVQVFQQTIESKYRLNTDGNMCIIEETAKNATNKKLKIGGTKIFGFTLDQDGRHPWGFIVNTPPKGLVSVCDGILVIEYNENNYVVALDLKSQNDDSKAKKQIKSGIYLVNWLYKLLKLNSHVNKGYECIGLVCKLRKEPKKGISSKQKQEFRPTNYDNSGELPIITMSNYRTINIRDLIDYYISKK